MARRAAAAAVQAAAAAARATAVAASRDLGVLTRLAALASLCLLLAVPAAAALDRPSSEGLRIPINLMCTTCDDFIRCTRDGAAPPSAGARTPSTVYRLREKTFWAQIATIWDYLVQMFRDKTSDERPFAILSDDGRDRRVEEGGSARAGIDSLAALITFPDASIDQRTGAWMDARGEAIGRCEAMKRREGYALVREILGLPPLPPRAAPAPASGGGANAAGVPGAEPAR